MASLALVIAEAWRHRRHRRAVWIDAPQRLLEPPSAVNMLATLGGVLAIAAMISWLPHGTHSILAPIGLALAALALCGWGHFLENSAIGGVGLFAAGGALAAVPATWFGAELLGPMVGFALAAGWMLWFAKFWDQQLFHGQAWTTTGRLIPAARAVALVYSVLFASAAFTFMRLHADGLSIAVRKRTLGLVLAAGLAIVFWRNAQRQRSAAAVAGVWMSALGGALAACAGAEQACVFVVAMTVIIVAGMMKTVALAPELAMINLLMTRLLAPALLGVLWVAYPQAPWAWMAALAVGVAALSSGSGRRHHSNHSPPPMG